MNQFSKSTVRFGAQLHTLFDNHIVTGYEIGVHRGVHANMMLNSHKRLRLTGIDLWEKHAERNTSYLTSDGTLPAQFADVEQALAWHKDAEDRVGKRCSLLCISSEEAANLTFNECLDFVYIDADHSYLGCLRDLELWWPKIRPGGMLAGHDYGQFGVTDALNEFFTAGVIHNSAPPKIGMCWLKVKEN